MIIQRHAIYQAGRHCGVVAPAGGAAIPMAKARGLRRSKEIGQFTIGPTQANVGTRGDTNPSRPLQGRVKTAWASWTL